MLKMSECLECTRTPKLSLHRGSMLIAFPFTRLSCSAVRIAFCIKDIACEFARSTKFGMDLMATVATCC